jgi:structural maintenance of chromosome 4
LSVIGHVNRQIPKNGFKFGTSCFAFLFCSQFNTCTFSYTRRVLQTHPKIRTQVLENFKSYAGEREIGPFHKCFSSVVGPNGSGKSNVIDAMLFVFGKRAKKLRLNKVSELIHSSDAFKDDPLQYARVSVHFHEIVDTGDADEDYDVVPGSEIVVTRVARRDNSSSYKLDGRNCAFKDVAKYLDSKGIDLNNNRFLILQGEVEMISMMPPKGKTEDDDGLLEYLEDIIGSNKFLEETKEASAKVEALSEQRQEKLNRVKAVEKEKEGLEGAKLEAEALLSKEREIRRKQNVLYQINMMAANEDAEKALDQKKEVEAKLEEERVRIGGADERVAEIESGIAAQTAEYDKIHAELKKTKEEFAAYERKDIQLKEDVKAEKAKVKKLQAKVKAEKEKEDDATAKVAEAEESIPVLEEKLVECQEAKADEDAKLEEIFEQVKGKTDQLRVELEEKTQELAPVKQERAVYQNALDEATTEVKLMEDSTTRAREQLEMSEKELASLSDTQQKKRDELAACEDELAESKQRVIDAEAEEKALADTEKTLAAKNSALMVSRR